MKHEGNVAWYIATEGTGGRLHLKKALLILVFYLLSYSLRNWPIMVMEWFGQDLFFYGFCYTVTLEDISRWLLFRMHGTGRWCIATNQN
jgi:hypothetical protein